MCPRASWRLLYHPEPTEGARNIAIDEAVLRAVAAGEAPPTLRFYAWQPTLTIGRGQPIADVDQQALATYGYGLIRRPTGGQAVLNADELTYSIVVPSMNGLRPAMRPRPARGESPIIDGYKNVSLAIINALHHIQLSEIEATTRTKSRTLKGTVCFTIPADYELTVRGRKLTGHAQMHIRGGILQHGTIPLTGDLGRISQFLQERPDPQAIRATAITLEEALGRPIPWDELAQAMIHAFASTFNVELEPGELLPHENTNIQRLLTEKYRNFTWTARI